MRNRERTRLFGARPGKLARRLAAAFVILELGCSQIHQSSWVAPSSERLFETGPYLLLGASGEAFVALKARLTAAPVVEWWLPASPELAKPRITRVKAQSDGDLWVARLRGLPEGPHISYRVRSALGTSPTYRFRAGAQRGAPIRFAAFGDTRDGHMVHRAIIEAVAREKVDFFLHTGDMVARGSKRDLWDLFFQIEHPLLNHAPILPAIGNHDVGGPGYFHHYFLQDRWAKSQRYYARDWGNLRVVALDAGIECRSGCTQYGFAQRALEDGAARGMFMVMALHWPPYSSGKHGSEMAIQKSITELAIRNGVELIIAGHDHNYERTKPIHGTTYIVSGSAGAPIRPVNPTWFTASARTEPHYVLVDVTEDRIVTRAINLRGDNFDTAVIMDNPPRGTNLATQR